MTPRKRAAFMIMALLVLLIGATGWRLSRAWQQAQMNAELIAAIERNDVAAVNALLDQGTDANARDMTDAPTFWEQAFALFLHGRRPRKGRPALEVVLARVGIEDATGWKQSEPMLLRALYRHGADPNVQDADGATPLIYGCWAHDTLYVQMALAQGADVNMQDNDGGTALMGAVTNRDVAIVEMLLARSVNVNIKDNEGDPALMYSLNNAASNHGVKMLLEHGAAVNIKNRHGDTPLKRAVKAKRSDVVPLLKQYGATE